MILFKERKDNKNHLKSVAIINVAFTTY